MLLKTSICKNFVHIRHYETVLYDDCTASEWWTFSVSGSWPMCQLMCEFTSVLKSSWWIFSAMTSRRGGVYTFIKMDWSLYFILLYESMKLSKWSKCTDLLCISIIDHWFWGFLLMTSNLRNWEKKRSKLLLVLLVDTIAKFKKIADCWFDETLKKWPSGLFSWANINRINLPNIFIKSSKSNFKMAYVQCWNVKFVLLVK